ncbi:11471_t:CDS:2 [Ambispora leptoticha]|uniref:11471_t:CDS:1 n=1 Tax=Ambispora leptoticha TaxID=144679 RepID=A0A9N8VPP4_9GLOM|nr:11471_t:CDS:2 [Ambispora leptoticha]
MVRISLTRNSTQIGYSLPKDVDRISRMQLNFLTNVDNAYDEEVDAEVTWEDQQQINSFSKLNAKYSDLEEIYNAKKIEKESLEDLSSELELADDDELVKYKIGDAFITLPLQEAQERIERESELLTQELEKLKHEMDGYVEKMNQLKVSLYGKFGKAINLERD